MDVPRVTGHQWWAKALSTATSSLVVSTAMDLFPRHHPLQDTLRTCLSQHLGRWGTRSTESCICLRGEEEPSEKCACAERCLFGSLCPPQWTF